MSSMSLGTYVGFGFYNIGIQNKEVAGQNWEMKFNLLKNDIQRNMGANLVDCVFLTEFGNMKDSINTVLHLLQKHPAGATSAGPHRAAHRLFAELLDDLGEEDFEVYDDVPYIALINTNIWTVLKHD